MTLETRSKRPLKIIMDSNALFVPLQVNVDIFTMLETLLKRNFELVLLSFVREELETLAKKSSNSMRRNASFALALAKKCTYMISAKSISETTDDAIVRVAKSWNAAVFTNDKLLKRKLRDISIPVIYVRAKSRLEIDGLIP